MLLLLLLLCRMPSWPSNSYVFICIFIAQYFHSLISSIKSHWWPLCQQSTYIDDHFLSTSCLPSQFFFLRSFGFLVCGLCLWLARHLGPLQNIYSNDLLSALCREEGRECEMGFDKRRTSFGEGHTPADNIRLHSSHAIRKIGELVMKANCVTCHFCCCLYSNISAFVHDDTLQSLASVRSFVSIDRDEEFRVMWHVVVARWLCWSIKICGVSSEWKKLYDVQHEVMTPINDKYVSPRTHFFSGCFCSSYSHFCPGTGVLVHRRKISPNTMGNPSSHPRTQASSVIIVILNEFHQNQVNI